MVNTNLEIPVKVVLRQIWGCFILIESEFFEDLKLYLNIVRGKAGHYR